MQVPLEETAHSVSRSLHPFKQGGCIYSPSLWRQRVASESSLRKKYGARWAPYLNSPPTAVAASVSPPAVTMPMPAAPVDILRRRRLLGKQFKRMHIAADGRGICEPSSKNHRRGGEGHTQRSFHEVFLSLVASVDLTPSEKLPIATGRDAHPYVFVKPGWHAKIRLGCCIKMPC